MYYSQCSEDEFFDKLLNKKDGTIVEVGAADGINNSNSKYFIDLGWKSLLIEPNPNNFNKLKNIHSNNENVILEMVGCSNEKKVTTFYIDHNDEYQQISTYSEQQKINCESYYKCGFEEITSEITTLQSLLDAHNIKNIDILSIDTEGYDLLTLEGIDFDISNIKYICIEQNTEDVIKFLNNKNFYLLKTTGCNAIYEKK
jgi:FkbM family methyltransferase